MDPGPVDPPGSTTIKRFEALLIGLWILAPVLVEVDPAAKSFRGVDVTDDVSIVEVTGVGDGIGPPGYRKASVDHLGPPRQELKKVLQAS